MNTWTNENDIISRFNEGDKEAFSNVFHSLYPTLCFFADKFVCDKKVSEDIVQDVFLWMYEKKPAFPDLSSLRSYLYRSTHNKAVNWLKKSKKFRTIEDGHNRWITMPEVMFDIAVVESDFLEELFLAVEELPAACRKIFKMSYIEKKDIKTICTELNIAETTVKTQRARAKKMLRERLKGFYPLACLFFFIT